MKLLSSRLSVFFLALLSGVLLSIAWPSSGIAPLLFIAVIPLLLAEYIIADVMKMNKSLYLFIISYVTFFTFNLLTTWWVKYASFFGAVAAIVCNALFMTIVFMLFHRSRKKAGNLVGYSSLIVYWISFEFLHMNWDLSWPWLTLGNGFAGWIQLIQWYEFTGVLGGTFWIWVVNILLFLIVKNGLIERVPGLTKQLIFATLIIVLVPFGWSIYRYKNYEEKADPVNVAIVQPNIDPYNEKFSGMSSAAQLQRIVHLADSVADQNTDYIVAPETAMPDGMWEEQIEEQPQIRLLQRFLEKYPDATWVIGAATNEFYPDSNLRSATARKFTQSEGYYDSYNTALQIENNLIVQKHHKSKLVPGVEKMPYPAIFKYLDKFAIDLGGISGSLGMQKSPSVFFNNKNDHVVAPVICYESIYGDYLSEYIRKGADLIFIITNDGWWSDTPGYKQHVKYATLRAVELRRSIARSANTGISCIINQKGEILFPTKWWVPDGIKATINANSTLTFYALHGDYLGIGAVVLSIIFLLLVISKRFF